jgi:hypothetical protein
MEDYDLLEFEKLKDEQIGRLTYRDTLFYFTMTIIGGAMAIACSDKDKQAAEILLALPFAVFIGGVAHITCDRRIDDIGTYVHDKLSVAVAQKVGQEPSQVFAWEEYFRSAPLHWWRKILQLFSNLMLYSASGAAILVFYLVRNNRHSPLELPAMDKAFWWIGMVLMTTMAILITVFTFFKFQWTARIKDNPVSSFLRRLLWSATGAALGVATGVGVIMTMPFVQEPIRHWMYTEIWYVRPLYAVAVVAGLIVWRLIENVGRR